MTEQEFMLNRQKSIERMKETAKFSKEKFGTQINTPPKIKTNNNEKNNSNNNDFFKNLFENDLNIPFLDKIKTDSDIGIILGLILLLFSDNSDKLLLIALLYILI